MKQASKTSKVVKVIVNIFLYLFLAFALLTTILAVSSTANGDGVPNLAGYSLMTVESDSMEPEIMTNDLIIVRLLSDEEKNNIKVGDVITFVDTDLSENGTQVVFNTHRVYEVNYAADGTTIETCTTWGDNRESCPTPDNTKREIDDIRGIYEGKRLPGFAKVLKFLCSSTGFLICILIPLIIVFALEIVSVVRTAMKIKNKDKKMISAEDEELIKQKAIDEYLKKQSAEQTEKSDNASSENGADK